MRLNPNAETYEEVLKYFEERTIQLYLDGFVLMHIEKVSNLGVVATYYRDGKEYQSFYLYLSKRGKGIYQRVVKEYGWKIVTSIDCGLSTYLKSKKIPHIIALSFTQCPEYKIIQNHYGIDCAKRSGRPFMNHIDEGLAILKWIGSSVSAKKAYCLHPIYQSDEALSEFGKKNMRDINIFGIDSDVIVNAVEYRSVANSYLSSRKINSLDQIKLSPLEDVNKMLIADKIQNRKDFEIYHKGKHEKSHQLESYFINWMVRLGVSENMYNDYKNRLDVKLQII